MILNKLRMLVKFWMSLPRDASNSELSRAVYNLSCLKEELAENLARQILAQRPERLDLYIIIRHVKSPELRELAGRQLLAQNPRQVELECVFQFVPGLRQEVEDYLHRNQDKDRVTLSKAPSCRPTFSQG